MDILLYFIAAIAALAAIVLIVAYVCYRMAYYSPDRDPNADGEFSLPPGDIYEPHRATMKKWRDEMRRLPKEDFYITSHDGLRLYGRYYEYEPGAVIEIMFHGYRGSAERDLCGGVQRCFSIGRSAIIVDQRASGKSDGNTISFGINESRDCHAWVKFVIEHFGPDVKIVLTGISMGAATVLIAAGRELPKNVVGVLADCGYTTAKEIISKTIAEMKLPPKLAYPFVRLGAIVFGHFDPDETSPLEAVKNCKLPVIFYHGEADDFVPCYMSRVNYEACASAKRIVTIPNAGHGLSYIIDGDGYVETLAEFFDSNGVPTKVVK